MRITESGLRRIIRSVIRESTIYHPEHGPLQQMPDGSYLPDDIAKQMYLGQDRKTNKSKFPKTKADLKNAIEYAVQEDNSVRVGDLRAYNAKEVIMTSKEFEDIVSAAMDRFSY